MISRGTLTPIKTSAWASPMVTVPKPDGTVRLCADYTNSVASKINVEAYPLPHPDDLLSSLAGNKVFSKLDLRTCYEQFALDENSKEILTVNTIKGLMKYERLPYSISSAPAIVQRAMEDIFKGVDVLIYLDDLLLATPDMASHLRLLQNVFERLRGVGARLCQDKCEFCVSQVKYLGYIISSDGKKPDPAKVRAISKILAPMDVSSLRSFLGLVQFYARFIPELATVAYPLHQLLKKNVDWKWSTDEQKAFDSIKSILSISTSLVHYDPSLPLVLSCDASSYGLGAILGHRLPDGSEMPICYASRTLSSSEKNYAHIDKEALSVIYGVGKFEKYLLGRKFILVSDHKPLEAIFCFRKGLPATVTARLHRYAIRLAAFNFTIEYREGSKHSNADAISRAPVDDNDGWSDETDLCVVSCLQSVSLDESSLLEETTGDPVLPTVLANVRGGWSESAPVDCSLIPYWRRRRQLSTSAELVMLGRRVVVPLSLRRFVLDELHSTHQGMEKMKSLARLHVWWPSIDDDIQQLVEGCVNCQRHAASSPATFEPWPAVNTWERVHVDFGSFEGRDFLVLIDAGSKWIEASFMHSTTTTATLKALFSWFTRLGFPRHLHSDGGPQFTSTEFGDKMKKWRIKHSISPPYHPQSNGLAERAVRHIKDALKKNIASPQTLEAILFRYRCTPLTGGKTPSEIFFGFNLRSGLNLSQPSIDKENLTAVKPAFQICQTIWARDYRRGCPKWQKAVVHKYWVVRCIQL